MFCPLQAESFSSECGGKRTSLREKGLLVDFTITLKIKHDYCYLKMKGLKFKILYAGLRNSLQSQSLSVTNILNKFKQELRIIKF